MKQHPGVLDINPAALVDLPPGRLPRPLVWTAERTRAWQDDFQARLADARARARGGRVDPAAIYVATPRPSAVMVWTPAQTAVFLRQARRHRLYALYHLIAFRGLRRGEACGLRRQDTDLHTAVTSIRWQITQLGWETSHGAPKSDAGERQIALDARTVDVLRAHRRRQDQERGAAGGQWAGSGFEFTTESGEPLHPAFVTEPVRAALLPGRAAAHPAARPETLRGHPPPRRRCRHQDRPGHARPLLPRHHLRHLHHRLARSSPCRRRSGRGADAGGTVT